MHTVAHFLFHGGFCDTDFVGTDGPGGGQFRSAEELAGAIAASWGNRVGPRFVVLTGGEPLLQVDDEFVDALHTNGFEIAVETNGTCEPPAGIDWVCVSPKAGADWIQRSGDELKLVYPQDGISPGEVDHLPFDHFLLQPMDGPNRDENTAVAVDYCMGHPKWKLSLQTHKYLGIP